jgi:site-specific DNA recombinase
MKNCYIYIRVSTDEQAKQGFSPDNQLRQCREYANANGYQIKEIFDDSGKSGRTIDRPELQRLLTAVRECPIEAIVIYKIDRFARNVGDFSKIYADLKQQGVKLLSINEGDLMEGNSLIPNIFASVAQWESEVNGQRTKDALMQKYLEGWQPTPPPIGYISVGGDREKKTCIPDSYISSIIREMFELYATGNYSILFIQNWLAEKNLVSRNGTPISHGAVHTMLRNPFYYGLIRWRGQSKVGKHVPIISKDLFDTCQYVLAKHRNFLTRRRAHNYLLRGFAYCAECGQRYTAEPHKINSVAKNGIIHYYHCQKREGNGCSAPYVETEDLEKLVENEFTNMQFSQEFIDEVVIKAREKVENNRKNNASIKQGIQNQKTAFESKRNQLEDRLLDGTIDRETYKRKHAELEEAITSLDAQLQDVDNKSRIDMDLIEEVLAFTRDIHQTYLDSPVFMKRHYLRFFYEKLIIENKVILKTEPTPIFASLLENHQVIIRNAMLPR